MINRIVLVGRLTADPEVKYTQSGLAVVNCCIAVERSFKDASGEKVTDFINCVAWRKTAELLGQYCSKGKMVGIDGSLQMRKYQTKEGENRTAYEVMIDNLQFLEKSEQTGFPGASEPKREYQNQDIPPSNYEEGDDELPF